VAGKTAGARSRNESEIVEDKVILIPDNLVSYLEVYLSCQFFV